MLTRPAVSDQPPSLLDATHPTNQNTRSFQALQGSFAKWRGDLLHALPTIMYNGVTEAIDSSAFRAASQGSREEAGCAWERGGNSYKREDVSQKNGMECGLIWDFWMGRTAPLTPFFFSV